MRNALGFTAEEMAAQHREYTRVCALVAACPLEAVKDAWRLACENGIDTVAECGTAPALRFDAEIVNSLNSLPCALQSAYEHEARGEDRRAAANADRALAWWRNRGYSY